MRTTGMMTKQDIENTIDKVHRALEATQKILLNENEKLMKATIMKDFELRMQEAEQNDDIIAKITQLLEQKDFDLATITTNTLEKVFYCCEVAKRYLSNKKLSNDKKKMTDEKEFILLCKEMVNDIYSEYETHMLVKQYNKQTQENNTEEQIKKDKKKKKHKHKNKTKKQEKNKKQEDEKQEDKKQELLLKILKRKIITTDEKKQKLRCFKNKLEMEDFRNTKNKTAQKLMNAFLNGLDLRLPGDPKFKKEFDRELFVNT